MPVANVETRASLLQLIALRSTETPPIPTADAKSILESSYAFLDLEHVSELITLGHWSKLDEYLCGYLVDRLSNGIDQDAIIDLLFAIRSQKLMDALNEKEPDETFLKNFLQRDLLFLATSPRMFDRSRYAMLTSSRARDLTKMDCIAHPETLTDFVTKALRTMFTVDRIGYDLFDCGFTKAGQKQTETVEELPQQQEQVDWYNMDTTGAETIENSNVSMVEDEADQSANIESLGDSLVEKQSQPSNVTEMESGTEQPAANDTETSMDLDTTSVIVDLSKGITASMIPDILPALYDFLPQEKETCEVLAQLRICTTSDDECRLQMLDHDYLPYLARVADTHVKSEQAMKTLLGLLWNLTVNAKVRNAIAASGFLKKLSVIVLHHFSSRIVMRYLWGTIANLASIPELADRLAGLVNKSEDLYQDHDTGATWLNTLWTMCEMHMKAASLMTEVVRTLSNMTKASNEIKKLLVGRDQRTEMLRTIYNTYRSSNPAILDNFCALIEHLISVPEGAQMLQQQAWFDFDLLQRRKAGKKRSLDETQ